MLKRHKIVLGGLAACVALYGGWIFLVPLPHYGTESKTILDRQRGRLQAHQEHGKEAAQNAFQDPYLKPYWGLRDEGYDPNNQVAPLVRAMQELGSQGSGEYDQIPAKFAAKDTQLEKAVKGFEIVYPHLHEVAAKPYFVSSQGELNVRTQIPNFISWRAITQAMSAYVEVLAQRGEWDRAAAVVIDAHKLNAQRKEEMLGMIYLMIGVAVDALATSTTEFILARHGTEYPPEVLDSLSKALEQSHLDDESLVNAMECEYLATQNTLNLSNEELQKNQYTLGLGAIYSIPGFRTRDRRIYQNEYVPILLGLREGNPDVVKLRRQFSVGNWMLGSSSIVGAQTLPNYEKAALQFRRVRGRHSAMHLWVDLLRYRQAKGTWPKTMQDFTAAGFKTLHGLEPDQVQLENSGGDLKVKISIPGAIAELERGVSLNRLWPGAMVLEGDSWVFKPGSKS